MSKINITVYSTPRCPQCKMTMRRMSEKGIEYRHINLANEPKIADFLRERGHAQAPVVEVTGQVQQMWSGFDPDRIDGLLPLLLAGNK